MFKSIGYKLLLYITLLILSVAGVVVFFMRQEYPFGLFLVLAVIFSLRKLYKHYGRFNDNILFLLNALDNGDYSFNFTEAKRSRREKELNRMMNRIKEILTKARKEVIENETFLSLIVESVSVGIVLLDENNNIRVANRAAHQLLGLPIFTHLNQLKAIDESFPQLFRDIEPKDRVQIKGVNEREEIPVSMQVSKIVLKNGVMKIITLSNIGNELEAREMESWIRLIRVMTHEIMNSIAPVTSLTDTLLFSYKTMQEESSDELLRRNTVDALETISQTAKGLISFVDSYRKFTGVPKPQPSCFPLIPLVEKVLHLESSGMKAKGIEAQIVSGDPSVVLNADESQVMQVLVNLVKNAEDAIERGKDGKIVVQVARAGNNTHVDVRNNGEPIPEHVLSNIFIPFFTTKDSGTGVGLSVSRYIMRLHGGNLKHHTEDGWTVFRMVF